MRRRLITDLKELKKQYPECRMHFMSSFQKILFAFALVVSSVFAYGATPVSQDLLSKLGAQLETRTSRIQGGQVAQAASGTARDVACSGSITTALQNAINASVEGDVVRIGAGSCSTSRVTLNDKNITVIGAGKGVTTITGDQFVIVNISGANSPKFRISNMTLTGSGTGAIPIQVWGSGSPTMRGPFRIDNVRFNYPNAGTNGIVQFWGPIYGLVDNNDFSQAGGTMFIMNMEIDTETCSYNYAWQGGGCSLETLVGLNTLSLPYEPGSPRNLYFENNTFTGLGSIGAFAIDTGYAGGRVVFRNNTLVNSGLYAHWTTANSINHLWWEVYNNVFTWTKPIDIYPMRMQGGGTGLIYNNTITGYTGNYIALGEGRNPAQGQSGSPLGYCDGTHNWDGDLDPAAPGWPCLSQAGRAAGRSFSQIQSGSKQASFPLYLWNNGSQARCANSSASGDACDNSFGVGVTFGFEAYIKSTPHPNGDVDWSKTSAKPTGAGTHTLSYAPFAYPYPLTASGMPDSSGTNPPIPVNGQCGSANGQSFTSAPSTNLCSAGTASAVTGSGPWSWSCAGESGGATAQCSAGKQVIAANTYYIRDGGTSSACTDWTNACDALPSALQRDAVYYVADGSYASYTFDDANSGAAPITVKKATVFDHGTTMGWQNAYGDGQAIFPALVFATDYVLFDGSVGGGRDSWSSGHGFKVASVNTSGSSGELIALADGADHITIAHTEITGLNVDDSNKLQGIKGVFGNTNLTFTQLSIHMLFGVPFHIGDWSNVVIEDSYFARNRSTAEWHSEGISSIGTNNNIVIRNSLWDDIEGTAVIAGVNQGVSNNWKIYGNIFSRSVTTIAYYHEGSASSNQQIMNNLEFYNNVIVGMPGASQGGVFIQQGTNNKVYNNIWYDNVANSFGISATKGGNFFSKNIRIEGCNPACDKNAEGASGDATAQIASVNPFVNWVSGMDPLLANFRLVTATQPGTTFAAPHNIDMYGNVRGADGAWDRGAIEFITGMPGTVTPTSSPTPGSPRMYLPILIKPR